MFCFFFRKKEETYKSCSDLRKNKMKKTFRDPSVSLCPDLVFLNQWEGLIWKSHMNSRLMAGFLNPPMDRNAGPAPMISSFMSSPVWVVQGLVLFPMAWGHYTTAHTGCKHNLLNCLKVWPGAGRRLWEQAFLPLCKCLHVRAIPIGRHWKALKAA